MSEPVRVFLGTPTGAGTVRLRDIIVLGCGHERATPRFNAIDVPPHVDVFEVYALLERGQEAGGWTFEEGRCGHPVDRG